MQSVQEPARRNIFQKATSVYHAKDSMGKTSKLPATRTTPPCHEQLSASLVILAPTQQRRRGSSVSKHQNRESPILLEVKKPRKVSTVASVSHGSGFSFTSEISGAIVTQNCRKTGGTDVFQIKTFPTHTSCRRPVNGAREKKRLGIHATAHHRRTSSSH